MGIDEQLRLLQAQSTPPSTRVVTAIMVTSRGSDAGSTPPGDAVVAEGGEGERGGDREEEEEEEDAENAAVARRRAPILSSAPLGTASLAGRRLPIDALELEELIETQRREEEERRERRESVNSEDGAFLAEHMFFADSIKRLKEVRRDAGWWVWRVGWSVRGEGGWLGALLVGYLRRF